jgi:hypothetical protein
LAFKTITKKQIEEYANETEAQLLFADGFDLAIIGLGNQAGRPETVVYDYSKCVGILMTRDGMAYDEAVEYMEFNVVSAWVGDNTPTFIRTTI